MYKPGLHIIAAISTANKALLQNFEPVQQLINSLVATNSLVKLGEVYHQFPNAGFTATVCLSESHLSLHTWPEYDKVNLDIYLSNFLRVNDGTVEAIFAALSNYFEGTVTDLKKIKR